MTWQKLAAKIALAALVLLAGCGAITDRAADRREARAEAAFPPGGQFVDVDGRRVHAVVMGAGPDLVLIHGAGGSTRDFTFAFAGRMAERYRVTVMDRPGQGYTDRTDPRYAGVFATAAESPREQARMLAAAAGKLGVTRPIVLGHSFGGSVAMAWALEFPEDTAALVIVAGATEPWPGGLGPLYNITGSSFGGAILPPLISAYVPATRIEDAITRIFAPNPVPEGYAAYVGPELSIRRASFRANARQVNSLRPHVVEMSAQYPTIDMPVEIVHGDADTIVPLDIHSETLSRQVPGANLTVLAGVGHMPHHSDPQAVADAIDRAAARAGLR